MAESPCSPLRALDVHTVWSLSTRQEDLLFYVGLPSRDRKSQTFGVTRLHTYLELLHSGTQHGVWQQCGPRLLRE
jgi:hypothetical protein